MAGSVAYAAPSAVIVPAAVDTTLNANPITVSAAKVRDGSTNPALVTLGAEATLPPHVRPYGRPYGPSAPLAVPPTVLTAPTIPTPALALRPGAVPPAQPSITKEDLNRAVRTAKQESPLRPRRERRRRSYLTSSSSSSSSSSESSSGSEDDKHRKRHPKAKNIRKTKSHHDLRKHRHSRRQASHDTSDSDSETDNERRRHRRRTRRHSHGDHDSRRDRERKSRRHHRHQDDGEQEVREVRSVQIVSPVSATSSSSRARRISEHSPRKTYYVVDENGQAVGQLPSSTQSHFHRHTYRAPEEETISKRVRAQSHSGLPRWLESPTRRATVTDDLNRRPLYFPGGPWSVRTKEIELRQRPTGVIIDPNNPNGVLRLPKAKPEEVALSIRTPELDLLRAQLGIKAGEWPRMPKPHHFVMGKLAEGPVKRFRELIQQEAAKLEREADPSSITSR